MLVCQSAARFPSVMVRAADVHRSQKVPAPVVENPPRNTRSRTAKAAALGPTERNAVTGAGAPWYTSGVQIWKGTVSLSIVDPENPYRYVEVRGRVTDITQEGADDSINKLAKKYLGVDKYPYGQPGEVRVIYTVRPEHVHAYG